MGRWIARDDADAGSLLRRGLVKSQMSVDQPPSLEAACKTPSDVTVALSVADDLSCPDQRSHHEPLFSIDAQGSCLGNDSPACNNSMEIPSGDRTNAI